MLTVREKKTWEEILEWEHQLFSYDSNDFERTFEKWLEQSFSMLPEKIQQQFFSLLDNWLFHLHSMIQGSQLQIDAKERILTAGRIFNSNIETVEELTKLNIDQLQYIANQQITRHRFYSFAQGGVSGTGGTLLLGADIPAMAIINLRVIQLIGMTYGHEVNTPFEMMASLKVFHGATLPARLKKEGWQVLKKDLEDADDFYFYNGDDEFMTVPWLEQPLKQLLKCIVIVLCRKKLFQGIPFISMAVGAGANYQLTRNVTEFAHKYYQYRFLLEKHGGLS
ncbi:EcsC family protein [Bacillus aquiflavi]|uniref:EcsC family protein n=1 Tax=Bacillus aquiflavi TaxID=2672567 RepID=UPI001CA903E9|nr:EcsC family protein [Bacillus aquiflavi]UAC47560.1 EcsC family protein [Bacillus aquiflavi]